MVVRPGAVSGNALAGCAGRRDHARCHHQRLRGGKLWQRTQELYEEMQQQGLQVNVTTYGAAGSACERTSSGHAP